MLTYIYKLFVWRFYINNTEMPYDYVSNVDIVMSHVNIAFFHVSIDYLQVDTKVCHTIMQFHYLF